MFQQSETMTIGEVAARVGMRSSALRYYESIGILPAPKRVSGQRRYDSSILKRITFIQIAQNLGFSIKEIKTLLNISNMGAPYSEHLQKLVRCKLTEVEVLIAQAQHQKSILEFGLICGCLSLEECSLFADTNGNIDYKKQKGQS